MLILRLPVALLCGIANTFGRRSDRNTFIRLQWLLWLTIGAVCIRAYALGSGDPEMQYFVATVLNLAAAIAFVLLVVAGVTWATINGLERSILGFIRRRFGWMVAWNFLRSHREQSAHPVAYRGGSRPKRGVLIGIGLLALGTGIGLFFVPSARFGPQWKALVAPLQTGFFLSSFLALSWPLRRTVPTGTVDRLDRWMARARTVGSKRPVTTTTFISIVGVGVGVWALIVVLSVMGGFENDLRSKILATSPHVIIQDDEPMEALPLGPDTLQSIQSIPNVTGTVPHVHGDVILSSYDNRNVSLSLKGVRLRDIENTSHHLTRTLREGSLDELRSAPSQEKVTESNESVEEASSIEPDPIIPDAVEESEFPAPSFPPLYIGSELANSLVVGLGSPVTVVSPREGVGFLGNQPRVKTYRVAGIFHSGMYEFDLKLAYTRLDHAQRFFHMGDSVNKIELRLANVHQSDSVVAQANALFDLPSIQAMDWKALNKNLFSALELEKIVMFIVLAFIVLVASFNIIGTLIMIIIEKSKEIAIMRAMGAGPRGIWRVFLLLGSIIGLIGSLSGLIVGLSTCGIIGLFGIPLPRQYYIEMLPIHVDWLTTTTVFFAGIAICVLATIFPAKEAARLKLVEGLRYE